MEISTWRHTLCILTQCFYRYHALSHYRELFHNHSHLQLIYEVNNINDNFKKSCDSGRIERRKHIDSSQLALRRDLIGHSKSKGRPNHLPMHRTWCSIAKYDLWNEKWLKMSEESNVSLMWQRAERGDA